jgi:hypothetical protein
MSLQALGTRIKTLGQALEQSLTNHNALAGRFAEAKEILGFLQNIPGPIGEAANAVDLGIGVVENVVDDITGAVTPTEKPVTSATAS